MTVVPEYKGQVAKKRKKCLWQPVKKKGASVPKDLVENNTEKIKQEVRSRLGARAFGTIESV
jgi:hypothetical protein